MIDYDEKHDVLYVAIGDKTNSYGDDSEDDVIVMRDFDTDRITGFTISLIAKKIGLQPVVHGRWLGKPICGNDNCRCSECGSWHHIHANLRGEVMQKYCPNCGAKMDEKEDEK